MSRISNTSRLYRSFGRWSHITEYPTDPILGYNELFKTSKDERKVNLTVGAYKDNNGKPWILPSVKDAIEIVKRDRKDMEYNPIIGDREFISLALGVAYGKDNKLLSDKRVAGIQSLSGLGACHLGVEFLKRFWNKPDIVIYTTTPSWPIHNTLLGYLKVENREIAYYNPKTKGLDFEGLISSLNSIPDGSIVLLHVTAHNPTGVDPSEGQWREISDIFVKKRHYAFFDMAYQGFASGNLARDNHALRLWCDRGLDFCLAQSFAKSMGLYGERVGTFSVVCESSREASIVESQIAGLISRHTWSSPPRHGSEIAKVIMRDAELYNKWNDDMMVMASRIKRMRQSLVDGLVKLNSPHDWSHITNQIGMFAFTGLTKDMVTELREKYSVFLLPTGRISISGLNDNNIEHTARSFDAVTRDRSF